MNILKTFVATTLLSRVRRHILRLTTALFLLFSMMTLFIVYSLEDAVFKDQLIQNYEVIKQGGELRSGFSLIEEGSELNVDKGEQFKYFEFEDSFGEFKQNNKHYHFMKTELGILVMDTSGLGIISRAIDDILLIMSFMLIPAILLTYWISGKISANALKPFNQLHQAISTKDLQPTDIEHILDNISEQDVKFIAEQLVNALEQKMDMLEEQIVFNQGMAHEIRTPLQVMSHSMELMVEADQEIKAIPAFGRLNKAIFRMNRISTALLWLTSTEQETHSTQVSVVVDNMLKEFESLLKMHQINVNIKQDSPLVLPMPEVVFELIVLNLLTNVIHHCQDSEENKCLTIHIDKQKVSFTNLSTENVSSNSRKGFGLGLSLVTKLSEKFSIQCQTGQIGNHFEVLLAKP